MMISFDNKLNIQKAAMDTSLSVPKKPSFSALHNDSTAVGDIYSNEFKSKNDKNDIKTKIKNVLVFLAPIIILEVILNKLDANRTVKDIEKISKNMGLTDLSHIEPIDISGLEKLAKDLEAQVIKIP